ncbi:hypothetical protein F5X98DRAFT_391090 [Xylaria grammica]|nr:hypothetical protein F5X98DRAFT_391090 [Xylaria grammica]
MRAISLPKVTRSTRTSEGPKSDIPSPLHIIKRTKTVEFRPSEKRETSSGSIDYGPDRPLSVVKKRQNRGPVAETTCKVGDLIPKSNYLSPAQQQPTPRAPLRWFSRHRTSSSGTTRRRYDLQSYVRSSNGSNGSSSGRSPSSEFFDRPFNLEASGSRSSAHMDTSFSSMPTSDDYSDDFHILVPRISVTSEVQMSDNAISVVWASVEISAQLSRPCTDDMLGSHPNNSFLLSNPLRAGSVSRFGSLYNVQVDVIPAPETTVIEVIQDNKQRGLNLGSTMLVVVKVRVDRRQRQPNRATVQKSNELIAHLESELRVASIRCFQVHLRYCHSGFPASTNVAPMDGTVDCRTQLETIATGVVAQHDLEPPLGLSPIDSTKSSLFSLVAAYWGPIRANEIFRQETSRQSIPMAAANNTTFAGSRKTMTIENSFARQIPTDFNPFTTFPRSQGSIQTPPPDQGEDPARKIWTEMRRKTSRGRQLIRTNNAEDLSTKTAQSVSARTPTNTGSMIVKSGVDRRREMIRDMALVNKRSIGADSLRSLVPSMMNLDMCGKEAWGDSSSNAFNKENIPPERRKEGRWSLAGWW